MIFLRECEVDDSIYRAKIKEQLPPDTDDDNEWQYFVDIGDGTQTEVMGYNQLINHLEKEAKCDMTKEWNNE